MYVKLTPESSSSVEKARLMLAGIPHGVSKAVRGATRRTVTIVKNESISAIRSRYAISAANIRKYMSVKGRVLGTFAEIRFTGGRVPLTGFENTTPKYPMVDKSKKVILSNPKDYDRPAAFHPGKTVYAHELRGTSPVKLSNTFVAMMPNGHIGVFERHDSGTPNDTAFTSIFEHKGLSIPEMLGGHKVSEKILKKAVVSFDAEMDKQITRIMSGGI